MVRQQKKLQKGSEGLFVELENRLEYLRGMSKDWEERERLEMIGILAFLLFVFVLIGLAVSLHTLTEVFGDLLGFGIMTGVPSALGFWGLKVMDKIPDNKPKGTIYQFTPTTRYSVSDNVKKDDFQTEIVF